MIHKLSFGTPYPGMKNPLDNIKTAAPKSTASAGGHAITSPETPTGMYQYFLKVRGAGRGGSRRGCRGLRPAAGGRSIARFPATRRTRARGRVQVVPTSYTSLGNATTISTNQYSVVRVLLILALPLDPARRLRCFAGW